MDLLEKQYGEATSNLQSVWTLYLAFYTGFITLNFAALGVVVQYIKNAHDREPVVWAFMAQNVLALFTALAVARYSSDVCEKQRSIINMINSRAAEPLQGHELQVAQTSLPRIISVWGGVANAVAHLLFIVCWVAVARLPTFS
jgi:hypothetical protein